MAATRLAVLAASRSLGTRRSISAMAWSGETLSCLRWAVAVPPARVIGRLSVSPTLLCDTIAAVGLDQAALMELDQCFVVDSHDRVVGSCSKKAAHRFVAAEGTPHGRLHRAFSVFLFDDAGRLLLQQRAWSKVTFPGVWTNTCCSHPLTGLTPSELDPSDGAVVGPPEGPGGDAPDADGKPALGARRAAVRKLGHELGVVPDAQPASSLRFVTRLHYCARDPHEPVPAEAGNGSDETHKPGDTAEEARGESPWGEHEIDYILLGRAGSTATAGPGSAAGSSLPDGIDSAGAEGPLQLAPADDEVAGTRWVTREELATLMDPSSGLRWSPWFRAIATDARMLPRWWGDLDAAISTDAMVELDVIHRLGVTDEQLASCAVAKDK